MMLSGSLCAPRAAVLSRGAFRGNQVAHRPAQLRTRTQRAAGVCVHAYDEYIREWPIPEFIAEVKQAFPEKMIATVEEARVLFSEDGYVYLDVRPTLECEEVGKVKGSVNIPLWNSRRVWDAQANAKVVHKEENPDFINQVRKKFPNPDTKLLVACSDGSSYSLDALEALDEAGYTTLVGLKGGFYAWFRVFDNKLTRRRGDGYTENFTHDGDGCGIHGTGAGFARMDKVDAWVPPKY